MAPANHTKRIKLNQIPPKVYDPANGKSFHLISFSPAQVRQSGLGFRHSHPAAVLQLSGIGQPVAAAVPVRSLLRLDHGHRSAGGELFRSAKPDHPGGVQPHRGAGVVGIPAG